MDPQLQILLDDIDRMMGCFDLTKAQLGSTALDLAGIGILMNMNNETDPDGVPWPALSQGYDAWKQNVAPGQPIGVLYGHMKQIDQINGTRTIATEWARMTYGIDLKAQVEAEKFQEGGLVTGTNQPPRPFYAFTTMAVQWADNLFDSQFIACT